MTPNPSSPRRRKRKVYCVPRRYDLATLLVVMTAYTILLGFLRMLNLPPIGLAVVTGYITCVGLAQALLFRGKSPRTASMLAGGGYFLVGFPITGIADGLHGSVLLGTCVATAVVGAMLGYVTGAFVGSVFMVADWMFRFRNRNNREQPDP